jgi:lipoyl(octanoyl) transferase
MLPDYCEDMVNALPVSGRTGRAAGSAAAVSWLVSDGLTDYALACGVMEERARAIREGRACELVWLVQHPPVYTAGASARPEDLLERDRFPVHRTGRGGQYTYHGPGQRVCYVMLDVGRRFGDVRAFVRTLERWLIAALADLGVRGECRPDRIGIWVRRPERGPDAEDKIAAIGVRLRKWVSFHGVALNVDPDLAHFSGIVPCGVRGHGVTSLADLGREISLARADQALRDAFETVFAPVEEQAGAPTPSVSA